MKNSESEKEHHHDHLTDILNCSCNNTSQSSIHKQFTEVLNFIMEHRSGETAELMQKWGLNYNMSYGVSLAQILQFVKGKEKNTALAHMLWKENIRETKLLSFHFFNPLEVSSDEVDTIVHNFTNHELVEQSTLYWFVNIPFAPDKIAYWATNEKPYVKMTAYMLLARIAMKRKNVSPPFFGTFFANMLTDATNANLFVRKSITFALSAIARTSEENKTNVVSFIKQLETLNSEFANFVAKTTTDELQYL